MSNGKVKIESLHFTPLFGNVSCGAFFIYQNELCLRTSSSGDGSWEAFGFASERKFHIPHTERVVMVDCDIKYSCCILKEGEYE